MPHPSPNPLFRLPKSLPLRAILILAFVGQVVGTVGLVGYLSFQNGQKAVNELASQLRRELTARIKRELEGYFEVPHEINRLNMSAFAQGDLDIVNATRGESQLYQQMRIAPTVAFTYCGSAQSGEFFGVLRTPEDGSLQLSYSNKSNQFFRDYYSLNVRGERTHWMRQANRPFDARQRPWYRAAVNAQRPTWTEVYIAFTTGLPNITASLPVYDRSGKKLLGVCATDVVLPEEFRAFLRDLQIGKTGQAFIVDRKGNLISNSSNEPLMVGVGDDARSLLAVESQDGLVRQTAQYLFDRFGGFAEIKEAQQVEFQLKGKKQFLEVLPFSDGLGLDWLIVVVVPEADFTAQIDANTRNTVLLCLGALGLAVAIGILTARWITRPIQRIAQASTEMAEGKLDQQVSSTRIVEMEKLADSFNAMASQIKGSFEAVRQSEATNRAIVTTIPDLMIRVKGDGTHLEMVGNDRLIKVYGEAEFTPGSHIRDSLPPTLAELRLHHIQKTLKTGQLQIYEQRIEVDGKPQDEEVRIMVLGEDEVLVMVRDITKRKQTEEALRIAEENYRSIYENALEGIFQSTLEGQFISVNPAMAEIYGYESPAEMVSRITDISTQIFVNPKDRETFKQLMEQQGEAKRLVYQVYRKEGSIIWVEEDTRAVRNDGGKFLYYEGIVRDITDRKRQEEEIKRQLEELRIEIDQKKRSQEVAMITQSDYFQSLQEEVAEVNLEEFWGKE